LQFLHRQFPVPATTATATGFGYSSYRLQKTAIANILQRRRTYAMNIEINFQNMQITNKFHVDIFHLTTKYQTDFLICLLHTLQRVLFSQRNVVIRNATSSSQRNVVFATQLRLRNATSSSQRNVVFATHRRLRNATFFATQCYLRNAAE
jgi:hypothetical protein